MWGIGPLSIVIPLAVLLGIIINGALSAYTHQRYGSSAIHRVVPGGSSKRGWYRNAAVAGDNDVCGVVATDILRRNGSAVDAGVAAQLCNGVVDQPHMGLGGGMITLVYASPRGGGPKEVVYIAGDDRAPGWVNKKSFAGIPNYIYPYKSYPSVKEKGLTHYVSYRTIASGVPGELAGYYSAWQRYGNLEWKDIVAPSIKMAREGFPITPGVKEVLADYLPYLLTRGGLKNYLTEDNLVYSEGEMMTDPVLANTLERIAQDPLSFYQGSLADDIIEDVKDFDGLLTKDDLKNYKPRWMTPLNFTVKGGKYKAFVPGNPMGGALFIFIYNVLEGYNMKPDDLSSQSGMSLFYHRYMEAWKYAFSHVDCIGDMAGNFEECIEISEKLLSKSYADKVRQQINDNDIQETYEPQMSLTAKKEDGTSHINILAEDGSVFSSTSSINIQFGNLEKGKRTGFLFNDRLVDFDTQLADDESSANELGPDRMARSFRNPLLITDEAGNPVLVLGASGGSRIISAVMHVMLMHLDFGLGLKEAIDAPRMSVFPSPPLFTSFYDGFDKEIINQVKARNHRSLHPISPNWPYTGVVQGISLLSCPLCLSSPANCELPCIEAVSDYRKGGVPDGF